MSTCDTMVLGGQGKGFTLDDWRSPYFNPTSDNVFLLIGCSATSPLFQGFPGKHLPSKRFGYGYITGARLGVLTLVGRKQAGSTEYGSGPPECCAVRFESIEEINLTKLDCEGYSSAYSLAPLRISGPGEWAYGIRVKYSVQDEFCRACEATGGTCGYGSDGVRQLCMCGTMNCTL